MSLPCAPKKGQRRLYKVVVVVFVRACVRACVRVYWEITDGWMHGDTAAYPMENSVYYYIVRTNLTIITAFFNRYLSLFYENTKCTKLLTSFSCLVFWFESTSANLITNITVP